MSASMAEALYDHSVYGFNGSEVACDCTRRTWRSLKQFAAHQAAVLAAAGYGKLEEAKGPEVRYATLTNGETELDEIVARNAYVHLEAMDSNHWWLAIESGGTRYAVNLYTKRAKIIAHAEED